MVICVTRAFILYVYDLSGITLRLRGRLLKQNTALRVVQYHIFKMFLFKYRIRVSFGCCQRVQREIISNIEVSNDCMVEYNHGCIISLV